MLLVFSVASPDVHVFAKKLETESKKLILTCLATGFYPKDVVMSLRKSKSSLPEHLLTSSGVRPNEDGTYQLRKSVEILEDEAADYDCYVTHSSLKTPVIKQLASPDVHVFAKKLETESKKLILTCLATGFYPKDVVMSLRKSKSSLPEHLLTSSGVRPNEDGTYQLRKSVEILEDKAADYDCYVTHSSLKTPVIKQLASPDVHVFAKKLETEPKKLILTCLATGFYPKDVVMSLRKSKSSLPEHLLTSSAVRPNEDGTYQLRKSVEILEDEAADYDCYVTHSSISTPVIKQWDVKCSNCQRSLSGGVTARVTIGVSVALLAVLGGIMCL
ncbi:hypothetical protein SRHO_G00101170 [Serrasalmus rhombeus]